MTPERPGHNRPCARSRSRWRGRAASHAATPSPDGEPVAAARSGRDKEREAAGVPEPDDEKQVDPTRPAVTNDRAARDYDQPVDDDAGEADERPPLNPGAGVDATDDDVARREPLEHATDAGAKCPTGCEDHDGPLSGRRARRQLRERQSRKKGNPSRSRVQRRSVDRYSLPALRLALAPGGWKEDAPSRDTGV